MDWLALIKDFILPIATLIFGGLFTWSVSFFKEKWANDSVKFANDNTKDVAVHDQAIKIYQDIINGLRRDLELLGVEYNKLEAANLEARVNNAILQTKLQTLGTLPCQKEQPTCDKGFKI